MSELGPKMLLAGLAGLSFSGMLAIGGLMAYQMRDEFQRTLLTRALVWSTAVLMCAISVWGYLQLVGAPLPDVPFAMIPVALVILTTGAKLLLFRQNRAVSE